MRGGHDLGEPVCIGVCRACRPLSAVTEVPARRLKEWRREYGRGLRAVQGG
jgi:hypothetical protein